MSVSPSACSRRCAFAAALAYGALVAGTASATPDMVGEVPGGTVLECATCHSTEPDLNPFGQDFLETGMTWSLQLAQEDSDGDGATNGEELGDPEGQWSYGAAAPGAPLSYPGDPGSLPAPGELDDEGEPPAPHYDDCILSVSGPGLAPRAESLILALLCAGGLRWLRKEPRCCTTRTT